MPTSDHSGGQVGKLAKLGVARISAGPQIQFMVMDLFAEEAEKILTGV